MTRHGHKGTRHLNSHMRRRLSEEGRRLLRHALSHDDLHADSVLGTAGDGHSVDLSLVSNHGDESADSDLDGFTEWQQQPADSGATAKTRKQRGGRKFKGQQRDEEEHDELEEAIAQLGEKRETTKVQALQQILRILNGAVLTDRMGATQAALTGEVLSTLKKRAKESGALSLRVLAVLAITIGPDQQQFYNEMKRPVQRLLSDANAEPALRIEAAYTLSIASYVCSREEQDKWGLLECVGGLLVAAKDADDNGDDFSEELLVALVECWAFLVSGFHPSTVVPTLRDADAVLFEHVEALAGFVREGVEPVVRSAACEALALLVQYKYMTGKSLWSYAMEETTSPLGGLESKLERYMRETAKSIGKKTRKTQRSMLKEVLDTLRTGEGPHKDLQIDGETLSVSTWSRFFQANVLRRALQTGFQVHLHENEVLREVFDVTENEKAKVSMISTVRRRADHRSKAISLRNNVSRKGAAQNAFLYDE